MGTSSGAYELNHECATFFWKSSSTGTTIKTRQTNGTVLYAI